MFSKCKIHDAAVNEEHLIGVGPYGTLIGLKWRETIFAAKRLHDGVLLSEKLEATVLALPGRRGRVLCQPASPKHCPIYRNIF